MDRLGFDEKRRDFQGLGSPERRTPMGLGQREPAYQPPDYPYRPQFQAPQSLNLRKALKAGVEAGLTTDEFNGVLGQIGVVNEAERAEALQSYGMVLADYQDQFGRMELERGEERDFKADIEEKRRFGLDTAKEARAEKREIEQFERTEAREGLASERKHALGLRELGLTKSEGIKERNLKREVAEQKGRVELAKGKAKDGKKKTDLSFKEKEDYKRLGKRKLSLNKILDTGKEKDDIGMMSPITPERRIEIKKSLKNINKLMGGAKEVKEELPTRKPGETIDEYLSRTKK